MSQKKNRKKLSKRYFLIILGEVLIGVGVLIFAYQTILVPIRNMEVKNPMTDFLLTPENEEVEETAAPDVVTFEQADPSFTPYYTENTDPANMIAETAIEVDGTMLADLRSYAPESTIEFGLGEDYTTVDGIISFRGDNFRNSPAFGYANMSEYKLNGLWSKNTGALAYGSHTWTGSGWTGQPLMMKWPKEVKTHMNMYDWAKADDELVEVIYACMDGYIYFMDLKTGEATRDALNLGFTFKGAGALDPRGYPIMYVGAGYDSTNGKARVFIINLLDGSVMYTFGNSDPFSLRGSLSFFDSSPLVDAETDTLIYPGENGILYIMKLNTVYDETAGTLSINPDHIVKWRYYGKRTSQSSYWLGMETSAAIYKGYLFVADNGGHLMCLDLNTLQLVWMQDILDDSNSTPVLSMEDDHLYLYVSTSFHLGWRSSTTAPIPIWKIDAENGEVVWRTDYECYTQDGVSGGVQSTIAVGENQLSDKIYVTVSRTGEAYKGVLACLDKTTGEVKWEHQAVYAWSSPVCVYQQDGNGQVIYCSCNGNMYLLHGETGEVLNTLALSEGSIEASPAVYENYAVVGTRACKIWGIELQ
ncbi:MAG: PQQ-binding-like beta-propeller repeat protein [Oliverpabstia sp.]|nr:PQQ-binding-like beta-propeller repeat protein [Oliverpabstia sp.]